MVPKKDCAVAIIAYSSNLSRYERASLRQCITTLKRHPLFLVCPQSLDIKIYLDEAILFGVKIHVARFDENFFLSVDTYNRFMLNPTFYHYFRDFAYILIYQLDAWVFRDELSFWCNKGYSYVGAPFFNDRGEMFPFAGNGGFSLRRVQDFIELLEGTLQPVKWNYDFMKIQLPAKTPFRARIKQLLHRIEMCVCRLSSKFYCRFMPEHEDFIFAKAFSLAGKNNVPLPKDAAFFSFERHPDQLYLWTGGKLPFGCHAYRKYAGKFWSSHI